MIKAIVRASIDNPLLVILATLIVTVAGILGMYAIPLEAIPDISPTQVIVKTSYPGQAPQVVQDQVTYPLETTLQEVPGARAVRGYSMFGDSYVYVLFKGGTPIFQARNLVLQYLEQAQGELPRGVIPALGPNSSGVDWIYEYALTDPKGTLNLAQLTTLQNWFLKFALQGIPGVAQVATVGGMEQEYQVVVHPQRMIAEDVSLPQVEAAIRAANGETSGSVIDLGESRYIVRTSGYIHSLQDLRQVSVAVRDGIPITLEQIARVQLGPVLPSGIAELNGQGQVVGGIVMMNQGGNANALIRRVEQKLHSLQSSLPTGVKIVTTYSQRPLIQRSIATLSGKLLEECIAVLLVTFLFLLRARSALVVLITLPVGILTAFAVMYGLGISANIMSLGGIAIAVGVMVDAPVVMIENMHKRMEEGRETNPWIAAREAALEVGPALFFSLLIITVSFLPIFALGGQEGKLFAPLAFTKTFAIAAAALLSISLVPLLMAWLIRGRIPAERKNPINRLLASLYRPVIHGVLRLPWLILILAGLLSLTMIYPWQRLGTQLMPPLDEGTLLYMPVAQNPAISYGEAGSLLQLTDRILKSFPEVKTVFGEAGRAQTATDQSPISMFDTVVTLRKRQHWPIGMTLDRLRSRLNQALQIPGLSNDWTQPIKGRVDMLTTGLQTPLGIKITGANLTTLNQLGQKIQQALASVPGTESVYAAHALGGRYIVIHTERQAAARYGISVADVNRVVETAIGGKVLTTAVEGVQRFPVDLRYPRAERQSLSALRNAYITAPSGAQIPLAQVARVRFEKGPAMLTSDNSQLNSWVTIDLKPGTSIGGYVAAAKQALAQHVPLPAGYTIDWVGEYKSMERADHRLLLVVPAVLLLITILLYFNFRNVVEVGIVLVTLPFSLLGGLWLVYLLHYKLSIAVVVGFIALAGVAAEFGVVMLLYLDEAVYRRRARSALENWHDLQLAVIEGSMLRLRPLAMTLTLVVVGLLPIMFSHGTGADMMRRIAAPVVGGMFSAALLALLVIPALYALWQKRRWKLG
ncbi:efflux RND transporter permease subunit [Acidithiobacillus sp. CV18-2]|uniref:Efflux RND transporter permease subunit n=1 Tax=Igneacidithiobacillus copahuensis TaxID=2724909 RepID=A0AAE3CK44_9PROT|nr:CusA/CzcA family heavy metal efflux RND transporter [Igneacidithiobacillus copahuensis]MBU2753672.1 efflux RND transporter permease subunit [Acidithiobacillus sp. CV18-3]MBU2756454.1 efflux RND transporter permease subunit [Acidithiobacillus sp. BN09-2]MBU2776955.1 efflux RND transporter permease subunit [Acidithiobacillus sp. CV18-2]MBU2796013.1 efflux RND transporter permease subunit [Acidithiobacillus sp. VAN18-2]MBU2799547.1 efflux RND transporter permease subunit [Acidithiobacillus sp.